MAMIEPVLHLFKIHRKMISGNPSIVVQNVFGVAPKSLNAIDVIFAAVGKGLAMIQAVMLAQPLQGIIAPKRVGVIDGSFSRFLPDDGHEFLFRHMLHHPYTLCHHAPEGQKQCFCPLRPGHVCLFFYRQSSSRPSRSRH